MQSGVNQGLVCPFESKLCQNVATGSRNPLECLRTFKTIKKSTNQKNQIFPPCPYSPPTGPNAV